VYELALIFCLGTGCYESPDPRQFAAAEDCYHIAEPMQIGARIYDDRGGVLACIVCRVRGG
jgi:hypothetical protein